jgi:opacity protein-like surface antigen
LKLGTAAAAAAAAAAGSAAAAAPDDDRGVRDAVQAQDTDSGDSRQLLRGQVRSDGSMPRSSSSSGSRGRSLSGGGVAAGKGN